MTVNQNDLAAILGGAALQAQQSAALAAYASAATAAFIPHQQFMPHWAPIQAALDSQRLRNAFDSADLIPSPSMAPDFVKAFVDGYEACESASDLCNRVISYYDADGAVAVKDLIRKLQDNPEFTDRHEVLSDVLAAHLSHLDTITTYPLVSMIEGLLVPIFKELTKTTIKHREIPKVLTDYANELSGRVGPEAYSCVIAFMEARLYESSNWWDDEGKRKNYLDLNRHRLLHGMAAQGTRLNTIRCLMILDLMDLALPEIRKLIPS